jgi:hypothetical protein
MTSVRKIEANRLNGRKSRGPRTAAGKSIASRNALRHGLAAIAHPCSVSSRKIEGLAKAIVGTDSDPILFEQALVIAKCEALLRLVAHKKIAAVERLRDPTAVALAKGDNSLQVAQARAEQGRRAYDEYERLRKEFEIGNNQNSQSEQVENITVEYHSGPSLKLNDRDEVDSLEEAMPDLEKLARYERRALSQRRRSIAMFLEIKFSNKWPIVAPAS